MALDVGGTEEKDDDGLRKSSNGKQEQNQKTEEEGNGGDADVEEDEDEEEDEPRLKYTSLTRNLGPLYRNGDATSAFLVAGDKMVRD